MTCVNESLKFPGWRLDKTDTQQSIETKITAKGEELEADRIRCWEILWIYGKWPTKTK